MVLGTRCCGCWHPADFTSFPAEVLGTLTAWRYLRSGMSKHTVQELLGTPASIENGRTWTFVYFVGGQPFKGTVEFGTYGPEEDRVEGWSQP